MSRLRALLIAALVACLALTSPVKVEAARSQDATTDVSFLVTSNPPLTGTPFTMAVWAKVDEVTSNHNLMALSLGASNANYFALQASGAVASDPLSAVTVDGASASSSSAFNGYPQSTWFHAAGVWASSTSRIAYLNGVAATEDTTSRTVTTPARFAVGNASLSNLLTGISHTVAHAAAWNGALTATEVTNLGRGIHPLKIRRIALVFYSPVDGDATNETDYVGQRAGTTSSAVKAGRPPLVRGGGR